MDHNEAVQLQACEKYLLGELSAQVRDAYEDHYFACELCAEQLRTTAEMLEASRQILAETPDPAARPQREPVRGWFDWLRPLVAVPGLAVLLLIIGYQNLVSIPHWRQAATSRILPMYSLIAANTRGEGGLVFSVAPEQPFGVYVDVPADAAYSTYLLRLDDPSGSSVDLRSLSAAEAQKTQVVTINPGKQAGKYAIVVFGKTDSATGTAKELARLQFTVEFRR